MKDYVRHMKSNKPSEQSCKKLSNKKIKNPFI